MDHRQHGYLVVGDDRDLDVVHDRISAWGHQPMPVAAKAR
jgi:hypothetical protein